MRHSTITTILLLCILPAANAPWAVAQKRVGKRNELAAQVKSEFLHAWNGYKKYAWGHDDLRPLSKTPHDWYGQSLLMTPVDALDTLILMKLDDEAAKAKELILKDLSFDCDVYVKN